MKLTHDGDYGYNPEYFRENLGGPDPVSGIAYDNQHPQLTHAFARRIAADNAWKPQTWADYMPGQPNPFVAR